jgi:capsular exopolysaccharide synthesis family protein
MEDQIEPVKAESSGLDIKELFFRYIRFLPLFIISVAVCLLAAYLYLRYATPVYKSNGALIVKQENGGGGNDQFQQMFVLDNSINIQNEIELLKSQPVMERVVEGLNLNISYYSKGKIAETNNYTDCPFQLAVNQLSDSSSAFELKINFVDEQHFTVNGEYQQLSFSEPFKTKWGIFQLVRRGSTPLSEEYRLTWQPTYTVAKALTANLLVAPKGTTGILLLSLEATHPKLAADVINRTMDEYQVVTREDKNETNRRMLDFIDGRLQGVQKELDSVTRELLAYQRRNNLINSETQSATYFSRIEETDKAITDQRVQDNVAQMIDDYLRDRKNATNLVPSTLGLSDATLSSLISAYNAAQLERKALIDANVPVANLRVQQLEDRLERLRINLLENLRNLRLSIAASIRRLEQTGSSIRAQVQTLPEKEQEMMEIKMQQNNKQTVFNLLMEQREQTAIALAGTISNMKVVEVASANKTPVKPNRRAVQLIAFVTGLAIPALFIFLLEISNNKVSSPSDIEKLTNVTILGEVGHSYAKEGLAVTPNNRGYVAEQFRIIRSNLQYILHDIAKPVLLVTSSFSGEGKSFISTNFSSVMALAGKRTIVLEFDIRKPKILAQLHIPKKPGLINYILGKASLEELPIPVEGHPNLFVLACGPVPPNPAELLLDEKLNDLFTYLRKHFDVIVIDSAPVGMVSDAMTLSKFANATLYIVRQGYTLKKQIRLIEEFYQQNKLPKLALILNDVKLQAGYGRYGYGRYGYGYGYGSNYFEEEAPPPTLLTSWFGWLDLKGWRSKKRKEGSS